MRSGYGRSRALSPTERAERFGLPRLNEESARRARIARMLGVLDRASQANGQPDIYAAAAATLALVSKWGPADWHSLAKQADPDKPSVKSPSADTCNGVVAELRRRAGQRKASIVKQCGCGREFTRQQWQTLEYVGVQDGGDVDLEIRNCPCTSSIAIEVPKRFACSICGSENCHRTACAEEAGARGLSRTRRCA